MYSDEANRQYIQGDEDRISFKAKRLKIACPTSRPSFAIMKNWTPTRPFKVVPPFNANIKFFRTLLEEWEFRTATRWEWEMKCSDESRNEEVRERGWNKGTEEGRRMLLNANKLKRRDVKTKWFPVISTCRKIFQHFLEGKCGWEKRTSFHDLWYAEKDPHFSPPFVLPNSSPNVSYLRGCKEGGLGRRKCPIWFIMAEPVTDGCTLI